MTTQFASRQDSVISGVSLIIYHRRSRYTIARHLCLANSFKITLYLWDSRTWTWLPSNATTKADKDSVRPDRLFCVFWKVQVFEHLLHFFFKFRLAILHTFSNDALTTLFGGREFFPFRNRDCAQFVLRRKLDQECPRGLIGYPASLTKGVVDFRRELRFFQLFLRFFEALCIFFAMIIECLVSLFKILQREQGRLRRREYVFKMLKARPCKVFNLKLYTEYESLLSFWVKVSLVYTRPSQKPSLTFWSTLWGWEIDKSIQVGANGLQPFGDVTGQLL